jgi:hypothetical protein
MNDWSDEETNDPLVADVRNFYKVEKWTRDGEKVDSLLYAGNNLDKTRDIFAKAIKHRPDEDLIGRELGTVHRHFLIRDKAAVALLNSASLQRLQ